MRTILRAALEVVSEGGETRTSEDEAPRPQLSDASGAEADRLAG